YQALAFERRPNQFHITPITLKNSNQSFPVLSSSPANPRSQKTLYSGDPRSTGHFRHHQTTKSEQTVF
ncbi:hypothetical protein, partial [Streptococcus anginosus]|uniref:hypothetical protein n=1 Tax=Streptococcus anginosus TaxID=1328 RepID=UPI002EDB90B7